MRNALAHAGGGSTQWRNAADQIRPKVPKLASLMDSAEQDVLAYMTFPKQHWAKRHSANPIDRLNGEIKQRTEVVGIFPTTTPSCAWSARCSSNITMNGPSSDPAT